MKLFSPKHIARFIPAFAGFALALGAIAATAHAHAKDIHLVKTASGTACIHTVEDNEGSPIRVLEQHGAYESATYLDERRYIPVFAYQRAFDHIFDADLPGNQLLMIGGGGYAWPKHVLSTMPEYFLDTVEFDQSITNIAKRWFFLDQLFEDCPRAGEQARLITADGRHFLEITHKRYSAIVIDTFSGKEPVLSLASQEAMLLVKKRLLPGGVYATNVVSECEGEDISFLRSVVTTVQSVFEYADIIPCDDADFGLEDNYLVIASDTQYSFLDALPFDDDFLSNVLRDA